MARIITELSDLRPGRRFCFEGTLFEVVGYKEDLEAWELCEPEERGRLLVYRDGQVWSTPLRGGEYQDPEPTFLAVDALEAVVDRTHRRETDTMNHKTKVGVDSARLLIIDPLYLRGLDLPDKLADLPEADPLTGFVKFGPAGLGLIVSPTGKGDGQYDVEVETFEDPVGYTRVARLTVTFDASRVAGYETAFDRAIEAGLEGQGFKGWLPDELRTTEARRLDDLEDRLRRLEVWVTEGKTGLPIYPEEVTDQEAGKKQKTAVVDHEERIRRLEAWVAGTEVETEDGVSYPLADFVAPWADPKDADRLFTPEGQKDLARLIYADPFAGLPEEAVPAAAAAAMRARQEARLADDDDDSPFVLEEPEWLKEAAVDRPVDQGYNLVIGLNNTATNDPCAICGNRTDPEVGPELFLFGTEALVCYDCGRKHAPALVDLLKLQSVIAGEDRPGRTIGDTDVILADVNQAGNLAAYGLFSMTEAVEQHFKAGQSPDVSLRLMLAFPLLELARKAFDTAQGQLYSYGPTLTTKTVDLLDEAFKKHVEAGRPEEDFVPF